MSSPTTSKPPTKRRKVFQQTWLEAPEFKDWLREIKDDNSKCHCTACNVNILCGKSELEKHSKSAKHIEARKSMRNVPSVSSIFKSSSHNVQVQNAEIHLSAFFAEHNVALNVIDHLVPVLKKIAPDSKIIKDISLSRKKSTKIITNVISKVEKDKLIKSLKKNIFSVLIDESTDISNEKNLCILVRYTSEEFLVKTKLFDLVQLDARDCTSEVLFNTFKDTLEKEQIPLKNITGLASDGAAVMVGSHNSFFSRLKAQLPEVVLFPCICHSAALVASHCCEELPTECEELIRHISSYFSESPKSSAVLKEIQDYFQIQNNKILKPATTRWLSLQPCICRILENWTALQHFFLLTSTETRKARPKNIADQLLSKKIKSYFYFLKYVLRFFNEFNALFQGRKVLIHILSYESERVLKTLAQNFIQPDKIDDPNIFKNQQYLNYCMPTEETYLGSECSEFNQQNLSKEDILEVTENCRKFYIKAMDEIIKRFPLTNQFLKQMQFLNPMCALDISKRLNCDNLKSISSKVPNCNVHEVETEWRSLSVTFSPAEKENLKNMDVEEFWMKISELKKIDSSTQFPNLLRVAKYALTFPHSNAEAERIFSIVTDIKTKKRNQMGEECLSAMCMIRSSFDSDSVDCTSFVPTTEHRKLMNTENLYK